MSLQDALRQLAKERQALDLECDLLDYAVRVMGEAIKFVVKMRERL